jgi:pimeloyl-ACP methyl ester carboxylesterase
LRLGTLDRKGIAFSYLDRGAGAPFVFQHGLGGDATQPDGLHHHRRRLVCLECRGHGATTPLGDPGRLSFATFADDVLALMDHLDIERALLGGVSMGAGVAARIALDHPERVTGLILVRPAWLDAPHPENLQIMGIIAGLIRERDTDDALRALEAEAAYQAIAAQAPSAAESLRGQFSRRLARARVAVLQRMPADQPLPNGSRWADITTPTLVIATHGDPIHPFATAESIAAGIPSARLHEVPSKDVDLGAHTRDIAAAIATFAARTQDQLR